jgi:3-oxoacyl-[acyl-carrier-protein] synthase III
MGARIEAATALTSHGLRKPTARRLADAAARTCLAHAGKEPGDIDMLINAGIHREDNMGEPALAALIQEDMVIEENPGYQARLVDCAEGATHRFMRRLGMGMSEIDLLVPAPSSPDFLDALRLRLGVPGDRVAYISEDLEGAYTTGPIAALQAAIRSGRLGEARNTLMLAAGAGITVALAMYRQTPAE